MKTTQLLISLIGLLAAGSAQVASAQSPTVTLPDNATNYIQAFDSISDSLPDGWTLYTAATSTSPGTVGSWDSAASSNTNTWKNTTFRFKNFASFVSNYGTNFTGNEDNATQTAATNRALGVRQTSTTGADPGLAFVLKLDNTSGRSSFSLNANFLNLDASSPRTNIWTIDYGIGSTPSAFYPVGYFTNAVPAFGAINKTISFGASLDKVDQPVWIRIVTLQASTGSGNRRSFAIDDFNLSWSTNAALVPVSITTSPTSLTNNAGTSAQFSVVVGGSGPITYQWYKGTAPLSDDGATIAGSTSATLTLNNVTKSMEGSYKCTVANGIPSTATSAAATLTVVDPFISSQPVAARTNMPGDVADFFVRAVGAGVQGVQWYLNGTAIPNATTYTDNGTNISSTLDVTNVQSISQGSYTFVVQAQYGWATSSVANLVVIAPPTNRLARWTFNDTNAVATNPPPAYGSGTAFTVNTTNAYFPAGSYSDFENVVVGSTNAGWNTSSYPANGTSNKLVGVQFNVSTVGQKNILVAWEERHSNTATRYQRFQYSINGVDFIDGPVITYTVQDNSFVLYSVDLSLTNGVSNNPKFAYRLVAEEEGTAIGTSSTNYVAVNGTYGTSGTIRYDLMTVYGNTLSTPTPIPLTIRKDGNTVVLSWTDPLFSLATSSSVNGAYTKLNVTSPYTNTISGSSTFYRLVWP